MTIEQLQQLACDFGIRASAPYSSQAQLIRNIQLLSGGAPCFLTEKRYLCTETCEWSGECRNTLRAQWKY